MPHKNLKEWTTMIIRKITRDKLQKVKVHKNQSNDEIISELIEMKSRNNLLQGAWEDHKKELPGLKEFHKKLKEIENEK